MRSTSEPEALEQLSLPKPGRSLLSPPKSMIRSYPASVGPAESRTWWQGVVFTIRSVVEEVAHSADRIAGIAACGQMHATVLIDGAGELVLEEVPLWSDKRTRELVNRFSLENDTDALAYHCRKPADGRVAGV